MVDEETVVLSAEKNDRLTRVGPGTPMGEFARRFWTPFLLSSELAEPDGPPRRVRLFGEDLIAFRQTDGQVGLVGAWCPHRGAPMFFGRNEHCGLRCIYHGWKFDHSGACVDMPNTTQGETFQSKVRIEAYPVEERGGVLFGYLGPDEQRPPLPHLPWSENFEKLGAPYAAGCLRHEGPGNWLQHIENLVDESHVGFLHAGLDDASSVAGSMQGAVYSDRAPEVEPVLETGYGLIAGFYRNAGEERINVRANAYQLPFTVDVMVPPPVMLGTWQVPVPIDDENTMFFGIVYSVDGPIPREKAKLMAAEGQVRFIEGTARLAANRDNDYGLSRELQRTTTFSGISGTRAQDSAVAEMQFGGFITDRSRERLVPSDRAIVMLRNMLLHELDKFEEAGTTNAPWMLASTELRGVDFNVESNADLTSACVQRMERAVGDTVLPA